LFNPRLDRWGDHFNLAGAFVVGRTDVGRTTVQVLAMNHGARIAARQALLENGEFPAGD
jgi:hypothetical protein